MEHYVNDFNNAISHGSFGDDLEIIKQIIVTYKHIKELNSKLKNTEIHYSVYMQDENFHPGDDYNDFYITTSDNKIHYAPLYYLENHIKGE